MEQRIRLGYVGCGFMAQKVHLPNFTSLPNCSVVAIAEVRQDIREKVADAFRIQHRYARHDQMAQSGEIDAAAISAGFDVQGEIAIDFLRRGIPVFMEKPMAVSVDQAQRILAAANSGGARLMIGYMKRYDAGNLLTRDLLREARQSGELGRIVFVRAHGFCGDWLGGLDTAFITSAEAAPSSSGSAPGWIPHHRVAGYLGYLQQYTHNLNLIRWLLDSTSPLTARSVDFEEDGLTGVAILDADGVRVSLESGAINYFGWDEHTQVYFEHGWIKTIAPSLLLRNVPAAVEIYRAKPHCEVSQRIPEKRYTWAYKEEARAFIDCLLENRPFDASGEDTLADVQVYEDIYRKWLTTKGEL